MALWHYKLELKMLKLNELKQHFNDLVSNYEIINNEITLTILPNNLFAVCKQLHDKQEFKFQMLIDLCGVDYSQYPVQENFPARFVVVYHLLSLTNNQRLRLKVFVTAKELTIDSVVAVWPAANWYEREAFDMYGIVFKNHPDLRRILTDYDFIGYPLRKDFSS
jgi:NADH-quinone oxidoreductase subunit C